MKRGLQLSTLLLAVYASSPALADDSDSSAPPIQLGLAPGSPQIGTLPGGVTPAYGQQSADDKDWRFDFHGFLTMPIRMGINKRSGPVTTDQQKTVLHAPPVVPDDRDSFSFTGVVPNPYVQLNFSYGNSVVTGNVFILARSASNATSFFDPPTQQGIYDAFLTFTLPDLAKSSHFDVNVGAFSNRYGVMGEYDEGRYGTPIIARTNGVGENIVGKFAVGGGFVLDVEQGFQGQLDKAPNGLVPEGWNNFADPAVGTSFVHHEHLGIGYGGIATVGLHYVSAWSQDDRATTGSQPDGSINVLGADLRLSTGRFGYFYGGVSDVIAKNSRTVGNSIQILNASGGPGLMLNYLGPNSGGNGKLLTLAAQYDLSLARLIAYPRQFKGDYADIVLSVFGMQTSVTSDEKKPNPVTQRYYDGTTMRKFGGEAAYSLLSWLALSARADHVINDNHDSKQTFTVVSPRVIFRSKWQAHDQVVLQYSHWFDGDHVQVRDGYPALPDLSLHPDKDMISLAATMWW
ncbi:MAG TPA: hypothetical protein VNW92_28830 [Polyangiaceae bacterium]|nr:hypothetical protein [Polyangiaceae bacterium]